MLVRRVACFVVCVVVSISSAAAEPVVKKAPPPAVKKKPVVAARVDGEPIYAGQVHETLAQVLRGRGVSPALAARAEAEMLDQLVDRRLVLEFLKRKKLTVGSREVTAAVKATQAVLAQQNLTLPQRLAEIGVTERAYRGEVLWQLSWKKFLYAQLTDKALEKFFEDHRRDFDGTQIRVSRIFWARKKADDQKEIDALTAKAKAVRAEIVAGTKKFARAAVAHSDSPTKALGGDVGFISRHGEMAPEFSAAAFALEKGEVSQPVVTKFGVDLIACTEVKPGTKKWTDAVDEVRSAAVKHAFDRIVAIERRRPETKIEFTGAVPHYKPGTKELVIPEGYKPPVAEKKSAAEKKPE